MAPGSYSSPRRDETTILDYHGSKIADPYVWLEDLDSDETKAFVEQQNQITLPYLAECGVREHFQTRYNDGLISWFMLNTFLFSFALTISGQPDSV